MMDASDVMLHPTKGGKRSVSRGEVETLNPTALGPGCWEGRVGWGRAAVEDVP